MVRRVRIPLILLVFALAAPPAWALDPAATTMGAFFNGAVTWAPGLLGPARALAGTLVLLEVTTTFLFSIFSRSNEVMFSFRLLAYKLIPLGLVWALMEAFWGGSQMRLVWLLEFFIETGLAANGGVGLEPTTFLLQGLSLGNAIMLASFGGGIGLFELAPTVFFYLLTWAAILISYLVIAVTFLLNIVGFYLLLGTGPLWVACGVSRWTAGIAEKYIGLLLQFSIRAFMLLLLAGVVGGVAPAFEDLVAVSVRDHAFGIEIGGAIAMVSVLLAVVTMWLPAMVSKELAGGLKLGLQEALAGGRVQE